MISNNLELILSRLFPGETVLVEYDSLSSPEVLLYLISKYCEKNNIGVLIDDIGDTLIEFITRLELMQFPIDRLMKIPVIKIGGKREIGSIIGTLNTDKYLLDFKYYGTIYEEWISSKGFVFNPVLGFHKLLLVSEYGEAVRLARNVSTFVGKKSRIAFYFMNTSLLNRHLLEVLYLLEETATTVINWSRKGSSYHLKILKSANEEIIEKTITLNWSEIKKY